MKKTILLLLLCCLSGPLIQTAKAQIPGVSIITSVISKVIKAIDLQIQKQQNKVIWLQNAQKELENTMAKLKLNDIGQWEEKQRKLYDDYFQELRKVKTAISTYEEVKSIVDRQKELVAEYNATWGLLRQDNHFTPQELQTMSSVYSGILQESLSNIEQLNMVVTSLSTQMSDGKRLALIHSAGKSVDQNISDMHRFNNQNIQLSLSRAQDEKDAEDLKQLYGVK